MHVGVTEKRIVKMNIRVRKRNASAVATTVHTQTP